MELCINVFFLNACTNASKIILMYNVVLTVWMHMYTRELKVTETMIKVNINGVRAVWIKRMCMEGDKHRKK